MHRVDRGLWETLLDAATAYSSRPAVRTSHGVLTFAEMFASADRAAMALRAAGLPESQYVVLAARNSIGFLPALLALWRHSATVGMASPQYGEREIAAVQEQTRPSAHLVPRSLARSWGLALGSGFRGLDLDIANEPFSLLMSRGPHSARLPTDAALVKFTSGSTGTPSRPSSEREAMLREIREATTAAPVVNRTARDLTR
jgi:acyl-CoA synthetase (AMP-forming)/AMP-acid ligase II